MGKCVIPAGETFQLDLLGELSHFCEISYGMSDWSDTLVDAINGAQE